MESLTRRSPKRAIALTADASPARKTKRRKIAEEDRQRAVRACDGCRRVKEKCVGGFPCQRCTHLRRQCEFSEATVTRSQTEDSYTPKLLSRETDDLRTRAACMERILRHHVPGIDISTDGLRRAANSVRQQSNENGSSSDADEAEVALEDEKFDIKPVEENTSHYSGEFSYWNFSMRIKRHVKDLMDTSHTERHEPERVSEFWRAEPLLSSTHSLTTAIAYCPPREIADFLVHVFFRHAESNYFYVERNWLQNVLHLLYVEPAQLTAKDAAKVSIALAIFAIGTQYAYLESAGQLQRINAGSDFSEDKIGTMFFEQAARLLPEIIHLGSLESVQACLLLSLYTLPLDASGLGYIYVNLAIKLAMQNGMHRKYNGDALSPVTVETRNRVFWTAYVTEKKISIFHGRPVSVLRSDADADLPTQRADMQPAGSSSDVSRMAASIRLIDTLESCLNEVLLLRTCEKSELQNILSRLITIKESLAKWFENVAPVLSSAKGSLGSPRDRSSMHLRLENCLVRMFVGRPFLFTRSLARTPSTRSSDATPIDNTKKASRRLVLVEDCVQAAKEAIKILQSLHKDGPGLARASYVEYSSGRASLLVLIAYCIHNQTDRFRDSLQLGLSMIREMAASGDSARAEVSLIEALERALARLQRFSVEKGQTKGTGPEPRPAPSGYDRFKNWEAMLKGDAPAVNHGSVSTVPDPMQLPPAVPGNPQHHPSHDWSVESDIGFGMADDPFGLGSLHSAADSAFFGMEDTWMDAGKTGNPERQVLQEFLAIPDYEFNVSPDYGANGLFVNQPGNENSGWQGNGSAS